MKSQFSAFFLRALILALLVVWLTPVEADAQLRRLRKRAKEKVADKVEQTVQERVEARAERAFDNLLDKSVNGIADRIENSIEGMVMSDAPEPIELGDNADGPADAPFIRYTQATRIQLGGVQATGLAGRLINRFGSQQETFYITATHQRSDTDETSSTIMDVPGQRTIHINHETQSWWEITFAQMFESMDALFTQGQQELDELPQEQAEAATTVDVQDFRVVVAKEGARDTINGVEAVQTVLVVAADYEVTATDPETNESETMRGTSYTVIDVWQSIKIAGHETIASLQLSLAEAMGAAATGTRVGSVMTAVQDNPAWQSSALEGFERIDSRKGMAVRTTTHIVQVPEGASFDLNAVLNQTPTPSTGAEGEMQQAVVITTITEIGDLSTEPFDESMLAPPPNYTQQESPLQTMGQN